MNRRDFVFTAAGAASLAAPILRGKDSKAATSMLQRSPRDWVDISPGANLEGWTEYKWFDVEGDAWRGARQWHMNPESGILLCDGLKPLKEYHSMFLSNREFEDFIFHVEWRFTHLSEPVGYSGYNSGVFVRMHPELPERKIMHQVETGSHLGHVGWLRGGILDHGALTVLNTRVWVNNRWQRVDPGFPNGWKPFVKSVNPDSDPKGLKSAYDVGVHGPVYPAGEWNTYEVTCRKSKITVWTNGFDSCVADNCQVLKGSVGLESEGHRIEFRNLRLKELA